MGSNFGTHHPLNPPSERTVSGLEAVRSDPQIKRTMAAAHAPYCLSFGSNSTIVPTVLFDPSFTTKVKPLSEQIGYLSEWIAGKTSEALEAPLADPK